MADPRVLARPQNLRADSARNRDRILRAARRLLADDPATLSLNDLAHVTGVGVGTVYRHFPTVRVLLESIAADTFTRLAESVERAARESDAATAFEQMITTAFTLQNDEPGLAAVLASPTFECADVHATASGFFASVASILTRAQEAGALRPEIAADDIRRLLSGLQIATRGLPPEKADQYLSIVLAGLRPAD